jgi:AAA+ superfamily predicted ATPase
MAEVVSTQKQGTDTVPEKVINSQGQKETELLANDKEYLEAYFDICWLYLLKRSILNKPKGAVSKIRLYSKERFKGRIAVLNNRIQKQEEVFWRKAEDGVRAGVKFAIEEIADNYKLDLSEKRLLLLFLYLEYFAIERNVCMEDELLHIFDTENSVLSRMRDMNYFRVGSTLFKENLLCRHFDNNSNSARVQIALSSKAIDIVSASLNGEECIVVDTEEIERPISSGTIGYVKDPEYRFEDVQLSEEAKEKVLFFLQSLKNNSLEKFGVSQRIKKGLGTAFLFFGAPGTGKSMCAEAVAAYVGKKVLVVEFPKIMDRFVGATDKNISRIFRSAEEEDLVVLLDEADTLFYNRSYAYEEHDIRFVNEMLQELEKFKGIIILTTNMDVLLDPALERRLSLKVKFELPSKELRLKIWQSHIPDKVKLEEGANFETLAMKYDFAGGNIKNAVLNAVRKMASRNSDTLTLEDLIFGANLEKDGMFNKDSRKRTIGFAAQ